MSIFRTV